MALPIDFIARARALLGESEYERLEAALRTEAPVSLRLNPLKGIPAPVEGEPVPWCASGYYLPGRPAFTFDPFLHAGAYYVQEASSMFLEQAIKTYVRKPVRCLDLCAAPGGKSTHLAALLPAGSLLVSNEVIRSRANILAENIAKWGSPDCVVLNNDPAELGDALPHLFDVIVADVPCSGEGMFRKDAASAGEWSVENVRLCAARQRRIMHDIWEALCPGGILVYSTCTYNTEEDEENIHYIVEELGAEALPIPTRDDWQVTGALRHNHPVYRFLPHKTRGEGFFLAVLRKAEGERREIRLRQKGKKGKATSGRTSAREPKNIGRELKNLAPDPHTLLQPGDYAPLQMGDGSLRVIPSAHAETIGILLEAGLRPLLAGICLGEEKGKDFVPAQELALSASLRPDAFPSVELEWADAIRFLRREALAALPTGLEKGYVLARYRGLPLGFLKHLGNRANNLYPQEWRIRSGYLPDSPVDLFRK